MALCTVILMAPALRLFPSGYTALSGRAAWLSAPAAIPLMLLYIWLISRLMDKMKENEGLAELTLRILGKKAGRAALLLISAWLLLFGGFVLRSGADRLITTIFPNSDPAVFTAVMGFIGLVAALGPARSLVRIAKLVRPVVLGVLSLVLFFAFFSIDFTNLLPVVAQDAGPVFQASVAVTEVIAVMLFLSCFLGGLTDKAPGCFRAYCVWMLLMVLLLTLLDMAIVGTFGAELTSRLTRPFFSLVRNLVFFKTLERMEALVVALWIFPDFLLVSLVLFSAQHTLRLLMGESPAFRGEPLLNISRKRWLVPVCAAVSVTCGILIAPNHVSLEFWSEKLIPLLNLLFVFSLVCLLLLVDRLKKRP